ncbi:hypothetical protein GRI89_03490 [Altererythrobacter salegens]|uniref:Uncharacterized protein n=1 Tax=Croceibacterium salegens TaxID=1737568 RepID=A0A6I4SRZ9_9SPHN|nr:hypothetical protein [Croceibacterium salegens]MXO58605.1 hypothetical protein [Croceibacterium salegens]
MKPSELLIGLRELFAFVVPGAVLLFLLPAAFTDLIEADAHHRLPWAGNNTFFLLFSAFAAYALGAVLSGVGSLFDEVAEKAADLRSLLPGFANSVREGAIEAENLSDLAGKLEQVALRTLPVQPQGQVWGRRAFWWNYMRIHCPQAVAEIDRLEAQQKLFRSLMVAWIVLAVLELASRSLPLAATYAVFAIVSFFYYAGLRRTLSRRLYQCVVIQFVSDDLTACSKTA